MRRPQPTGIWPKQFIDTAETLWGDPDCIEQIKQVGYAAGHPDVDVLVAETIIRTARHNQPAAELRAFALHQATRLCANVHMPAVAEIPVDPHNLNDWLDGPDVAVADQLAAIESHDVIKQALGSLSAAQADVLIGHAVEDHTLAHYAALNNIALGTAHSRLYHAHRIVEQHFNNYDTEGF